MALPLGVLLAAALLAPARGALDRAHVAVHKRLAAPGTGGKLVVGRPMQVLYTVANLGPAPALDVRVTDTFPAINFDALPPHSGTVDIHLEELPAHSNVTHLVELRPLVAGVMTIGRAELGYKYRLPPEEAALANGEEFAEARSASTNWPEKIDIFSTAAYEALTRDKTPGAIGLAAAAGVLTLLPYGLFWLAARANDAAAAAAAAAAASRKAA